MSGARMCKRQSAERGKWEFFWQKKVKIEKKRERQREKQWRGKNKKEGQEKDVGREKDVQKEREWEKEKDVGRMRKREKERKRELRNFKRKNVVGEMKSKSFLQQGCQLVWHFSQRKMKDSFCASSFWEVLWNDKNVLNLFCFLWRTEGRRFVVLRPLARQVVITTWNFRLSAPAN